MAEGTRTRGETGEVGPEIEAKRPGRRATHEHEMGINRSGSIRRTKADMEHIRAEIVTVLNAYHPMTVRQVFYQLTTRKVIAKAEGEYKQTVVRLLTEMRRARMIPFGWIADSTRWMRKPRSHDNMTRMLEESAELYRRALWNDQDAYVEVWLEKDALAGVVYEETNPWDVPLMVTKGYPSVSYLYEAAETIADQNKPTYLYYLGDHDPSGLDITKTVERGIREYAPDADIHFERIAVTREQIVHWNLPTRPTKKSDSRAKSFEGESVEVDSIPPEQLRWLVRSHIVQHIDAERLQQTKLIEGQERRTLEVFASQWPAV